MRSMLPLFAESSGWNLANARYVYEFLTINNEYGRGMTFSPDGKIMQIIGSDSYTVFLSYYDLSIGFDIRTAVYNSTKSYSSGSTINYKSGFAYTPDGLRIFFTGAKASTFERIYSQDITIPYDIGVVTNTSYLDLNPLVPVGNNLSFDMNSLGTKLYISDITAGIIYQYTMSTSWDITSAVYDSKSFLSVVNSLLRSQMSPDGKVFMVAIANVGVTTEVDEYFLSTPYDISTAIFVKKYNTEYPGILSFQNAFYINPSGTVMVLADFLHAPNQNIYVHYL